MNEAKEEVYQEVLNNLWGLFQDSPYIRNFIETREKHGCLLTTITDFHCQMALQNDVYPIILFEILPAEIEKGNEFYEMYLIRNKYNDITIYYQSEVDELLVTGGENNGIWQALHSLLFAIKELVAKEGDNVKFVWGE